MDARISTDVRIAALITAALDGTFTEEQAEQLAAVDHDLSKLAWLAASRRIAELEGRLKCYSIIILPFYFRVAVLYNSSRLGGDGRPGGAPGLQNQCGA